MPSNAASSSTFLPPPKVEQVLHVRAKSILSCTFGRSAASSRSGVAPPPSYQTVTVDGVTALLHLSSRDGTVRTVGSVHWQPPNIDQDTAGKAPADHDARVSIGENTCDFSDVLRKNKGVSRDLKLKSDIRAVHLPGEDASAPLHFQRVAMPTGGFPYTVYTIADMSLPPGPTRAHICVGQLTIKRSSKPRATTSGNLPAILPFLSSSRNQSRSPATLAPPAAEAGPSPSGVTVRLELRTRDKELIDRIVFSSLLIVAGRHPVEADKRVELDRPAENEWDAPPALSTLATPHLTPNPSSENLPLSNNAPPQYQGDYTSETHLLVQDNSAQDLVGSDPFGTPGAGPSTMGMAGHAISVMSVHSSAGSSQSIASAA
ncbi:hypothetical protein FRC12_017529 [Ceratobasidium sp. 428]|nr:hypothetical protein FRC09_008425 [Ceratobasidium sp. 395]KAG8736609.1 hypothetical protein FRC12_017529 [Ceratobasidium sp. 428]